MASWNLESVGTKGYGGGGSYFCARAAKSFLKRKEEADAENYDGVGVFRDPLMDSVYGQCSSTTRPQRQSAQDDQHSVSHLLKPTELEQALAAARAQHGKNKGNDACDGASSRRTHEDQTEEIHVVFEEPFTSRGGRKGGGISLVCMGSSEHTVYVLQITCNARRWSVERRYSEFDMLARDLQRVWASDPSVSLGELPSKVWMGKLTKETQSRRKDDLEQYMNQLLSNSRLVQESAELRAFLEVPPRHGAGKGPPPVISRPYSVSSPCSWRDASKAKWSNGGPTRDLDEDSL